ncbi:MAG: amidohydrolase family protein [bacterium]
MRASRAAPSCWPPGIASWPGTAAPPSSACTSPTTPKIRSLSTASLTENPNLYVDVAARLPEIGRHDPAAVRAVFLRHADRILFGTDLGITRGIMPGSVGQNRPGLPDVFLFYADHFRWFETTDRAMPHPTPIQGEWTIDGVGLPRSVLRKVYHRNALKLLFGVDAPTAVDRDALVTAPWSGVLRGRPARSAREPLHRGDAVDLLDQAHHLPQLLHVVDEHGEAVGLRAGRASCSPPP